MSIYESILNDHQNLKNLMHNLIAAEDEDGARAHELAVEVLFKLGQAYFSEEEAYHLGQAFSKMKSLIRKNGFSKENFDFVMGELPPFLLAKLYPS